MLESQIDHYLRRFQNKRLSKPTCCQVCKRSGRLRWHGIYVRQLISLTKIYSVPVRRLFCTLCRHTFALLPFFIVKFHRYARDVIRTALSWLKTRTSEKVAEHLANRLTEPSHHPIGPLTLYFWRRKFS